LAAAGVLLAGLGGICSVLLGGCVPPVPQGLDSPDPNLRLQAIVRAAYEGSGEEVIPGLIDRLESLDPAARMLAIRALERRTGQTLGYHHADPVWKRRQAIADWRDWWAESRRGRSGGDPSDEDTASDG
jgi:hypothetical protein